MMALPKKSSKPAPAIPDSLSSAVDRCLGQLPVIVLGSGASAAHGVPGMPALQAHLLGHVKPANTADEDAWLLVKTALAAGDDLETALLRNKVSDDLSRQIVDATWSLIAHHDDAVFERMALGTLDLPLTRLLRWLTRSTHREVPVVTTNYDRLAEYAADAAGLIHLNGFAPGYLRNRETSTPYRIMRGRQTARTARLWKVHGSLDWFERPGGEIICARFGQHRPVDLQPVIVTPGVEKFQRTHAEPFRSIMTGADMALETANAVICIGYGFRDQHIEPKLVDRCTDHNIPILMLTKALTDDAKAFLNRRAGSSFLALEEDGTGTRFFTPDTPGGGTIANSRLWSLDAFLSAFIS
jgi:hypothetical protein